MSKRIKYNGIRVIEIGWTNIRKHGMHRRVIYNKNGGSFEMDFGKKSEHTISSKSFYFKKYGKETLIFGNDGEIGVAISL